MELDKRIIGLPKWIRDYIHNIESRMLRAEKALGACEKRPEKAEIDLATVLDRVTKMIASYRKDRAAELNYLMSKTAESFAAGRLDTETAIRAAKKTEYLDGFDEAVRQIMGAMSAFVTYEDPDR